MLAPLAKKVIQGTKFVVVVILPYMLIDMLTDDATVLKVLNNKTGIKNRS